MQDAMVVKGTRVESPTQVQIAASLKVSEIALRRQLEAERGSLAAVVEGRAKARHAASVALAVYGLEFARKEAENNGDIRDLMECVNTFLGVSYGSVGEFIDEAYFGGWGPARTLSPSHMLDEESGLLKVFVTVRCHLVEPGAVNEDDDDTNVIAMLTSADPRLHTLMEAAQAAEDAEAEARRALKACVEKQDRIASAVEDVEALLLRKTLEETCNGTEFLGIVCRVVEAHVSGDESLLLGEGAGTKTGEPG